MPQDLVLTRSGREETSVHARRRCLSAQCMMSEPVLSMSYTAKGLQLAWERRGTFAFVVFTLLSLVARLMLWPQIELLFAVIAVGLFSFGFSPAGIWVGTAHVIPESFYGNTLWSNAPELSVSRPSSLVGLNAVILTFRLAWGFCGGSR